VGARSSGRKSCSDLVGASGGGTSASLPPWRRMLWSSACTPRGFGLSGKIPSFGSPSGRWWRLRRNLLGGIIFESRHRLMAYASSSSGWWMSGQRSREDDVCALRRRPRKPWWAPASWGEAVAWMGLGGYLLLLGRRGSRLGQRVSAEAV
jgi:CcmD family protein